MMERGKITPMALAIVLVVGVFIWFLPPAHPCMINAGSMGAIGDEPLHMVGSDCPPPPSTQQLISATEQQCTELNVEWEEWSRKEYTRGMEILDRPTVMYYYELASWSVNHETDMCYMIDVTPAHMFSGERVRVPILQVMDEMDETCFRFIDAEEKELVSGNCLVWTGEFAFGAAECEKQHYSGRGIDWEQEFPDIGEPIYLEPANLVWSEWYVCSTGIDTNYGSVIGFDID